MIEEFKRRLRSLLAPFNRAHQYFASSSALALLFPMMSAPIVSRLYSPQDFGVYAVFFALATICASISSLELRNVALLEADATDSAQGAGLAILVVVLFSFVLALGLYVSPLSMLIMLLGKDLLPVVGWLPVTTFFMGVSIVLYTWATKESEYLVLARNKLILAISTMLFQVGIGLSNPGPMGFVAANLLGLILATIFLWALFRERCRELDLKFDFRFMWFLFKRHNRLIFWTTPATLINNLSQYLPDLLINRIFGSALLGQYSLASRMLNIPLGFMSSSLQDMFRQQAADEFHGSGACPAAYRRFLVIASVSALLLVFPLILVLPTLFPIIFGEQWTEAGLLIRAVVFITIVRFIASPLSYVWILAGRERLDFFWQLGLLAISALSLLTPLWSGSINTLFAALVIYSISCGLWYVLSGFVSFRLSSTK